MGSICIYLYFRRYYEICDDFETEYQLVDT